MKIDRQANRKKYKSMQEELAARRAELGEEADPSQGRFDTGWTSKKKTKPGISRGRKRGVPTEILKKKPSNKERPSDNEESFDKEQSPDNDGSVSTRVGKLIVAAVTVCIAIIAFAVFDSDLDETAYDYLDETSGHEEVLEYLEDSLDVDWDVDGEELKEWERTRLDGIIGNRLETWNSEVSREHVIITTSYDDDKEDFDSFRERCEEVCTDIEDDLYYQLDNYPAVVLEARGVFPYSDHEPNLRLLIVNGVEEFSFEEY